MSNSESGEWLVFDEEQPCPYLPDQTARMPIRLPRQPVLGERFDEALSRGDRRSGGFLYRTSCPGCEQCEPIRIPVQGFAPSVTQRRVFRRGEERFEVRVGEPLADEERVRLFNAHRRERGLAARDGDYGRDSYVQFLVESCTRTVEISYRLEGRLVGVAICDQGREAWSAVYCYYDPGIARFSPGAYSILKHIQMGRAARIKYLYLGYYIANCRAMSYKRLYRPHERRLGGRWIYFE